jgi:hypothetical protein
VRRTLAAAPIFALGVHEVRAASGSIRRMLRGLAIFAAETALVAAADCDAEGFDEARVAA